MTDDQRERAIQAAGKAAWRVEATDPCCTLREQIEAAIEAFERALAQSDEGVPQPVREAIARLREPYTYAYSDSGEAYMDGKILADFIDPSGLSREGEGT